MSSSFRPRGRPLAQMSAEARLHSWMGPQVHRCCCLRYAKKEAGSYAGGRAGVCSARPGLKELSVIRLRTRHHLTTGFWQFINIGSACHSNPPYVHLIEAGHIVQKDGLPALDVGPEGKVHVLHCGPAVPASGILNAGLQQRQEGGRQFRPNRSGLVNRRQDMQGWRPKASQRT